MGAMKKDVRLQVVMDEVGRAQLGVLAEADGVSMGEEVRKLVRRETARRRSKAQAGGGSGLCTGCPRAGA